MFNIFGAKVRKESGMKFFDKLKLGGAALEVLEWARDVVSTIDVNAALAIVLKVVEIERDRRGVPGATKLHELLAWVEQTYPGGNTTVVVGYVKSIVTMLNALGVFRK